MGTRLVTRKLMWGVLFTGLFAGFVGPATAQTNIDASASGKYVNKEILGSTTIHIRPWVITGDQASEVQMAGGLDADEFNWQDPTSTTANWTWWESFYYSQQAAYKNSTVLNIVNMRGVYNQPGGTFNTDINNLKTLASDWVKYSNFIVQNYHTGDTAAPADQAILDKLNWTRSGQKLANTGELMPAPVKYWIIGNEPGIKTSRSGRWFTNPGIFGQPSGSWSLTEYVSRYTQLANAMKTVDPTIKVGPGMLRNVDAVANQILASSAPIDFWAYHSYDGLGTYYKPNGTTSQINAMEGGLRGLRQMQTDRYNTIRQAFTDNGRNPDQVEFMVTEWSVLNDNEFGDLSSNGSSGTAPSMYQALGFAETIFAFAHLGLKSGNYWGETKGGNPFGPVLDDSERYPMVEAWWKLRDKLGDTLVDSIADNNSNQRVYTTRDSQTGGIKIWGLNFDNDNAADIALALSGMNVSNVATLSILGGEGTKLWTSMVNIGSDWTAQTITNFNAANFNLHIPSASIVLLEVAPVPEPAALGLLGVALLGLGARRRRPV